MSRPPSTCSRPSGSESRMTASTAATNGCRFAASVARAGPDLRDRAEPEDVRQHERADGGEHEQRPDPPAEVPVLLARLRDPGQRDQRPGRRDDNGAHARGRVDGHERGDGHRVRGPGRADRDARAGSRRSRPRPRCPRRPPPARRRRTRPPRRARSAGSGCSRPRASPKSAAKIGMAPRIRPIVEAVVLSSAKTNDTWFSQSTTAANASTGMCRRWILSVRSTRSVRARKIAPASAYRTDRVRERCDSLLEDVLRDAEVERPQDDGRQEHQLDRRRSAHAPTLSARLEPELAKPHVDGFSPAAVRGGARGARVRDAPDANPVSESLVRPSLGEAADADDERGPSTSTILASASSQMWNSGARSPAGSLSGVRFRPDSSMKTSGHQFATKTRSKNRSAVEKRSRAQPQKPGAAHLRARAREARDRPPRMLASRPSDRSRDPEEVAHHRDVAERNARLRHAERPGVHADQQHLSRRLRSPALEVRLVRHPGVASGL